jgi:peptidoglycan/LPS O-acetylase OafA/YrhL
MIGRAGTGLTYRPEIDGLRAIAVLPVIFFHARFAYFQGGFVGVDVFFVISGYLITSIILAEIEKSSFTLLGFYERRARRILPALFLVSLACIPFAWLWMIPRDLVDFSKSLMAVATFVSNIFFWKQSGYFETANELKPLVHTWSLAVEEQYYLGFPIFLIVALRFGKRWTLAAIAAFAGVSFVTAQWGSTHAPVASFFLLPTRVWELLIGAMVPFIRQRPGRAAGEFLSIAGLALIGFAILSFDDVPYPGVYALVPTLGAVLLIFCADARTLVGKLLSNRILVGLGLVSYSAYLWHQPLFVFARLVSIREPDPVVFFMLSVAAIALAWLSWKFVESPFRNRRWVARRTVFALACAGTMTVASFGFAGFVTSGFEQSFNVQRLNDRERQIYALIKRHTGGDMSLDRADNGACNFWSKAVDDPFRKRFDDCAAKFKTATVVLGDSHAMSIYNALFSAKFDSFLVGLSQASCRTTDLTPRCHYAAFKEFLARHRDAIGVVIFNQSGSYLMRDYAGRLDSSETFYFGRRYTFDFGLIKGIADYLDQLSPMARVIWLGPYVEARVDFRNLKQIAKNGFKINPISLDAFARLEGAIEKYLSSGKHGFEFVPVGSLLKIDADFLLLGDCLTYRDEDHFSICGEKIVGERLKPALQRYRP